MGLTSSLFIGRSALGASNVALQVAGNNLANAADPNYARRLAHQTPIAGPRFGATISTGLGVRVNGISRRVDTALQDRLLTTNADANAAQVSVTLLSSVETTLNELSDNDLSSRLVDFFNAWSALASNPGDLALKNAVLEEGRTLSGFVRDLRSDLLSINEQIDGQIEASVERANQLTEEVASINASIVLTEAGSASANALRDQRDALLTELSELVDISTVEQASGAVDVLVGSTPIVLGTQSRGLNTASEATPDGIDLFIRTTADQQDLAVRSGRIGALLDERQALLDETIGRLDEVASHLIHQVNRVHSTGSGTELMTSAHSTVRLGDPNAPLNDPTLQPLDQLPFNIEHGSFVVNWTNELTGTMESARINLNLLPTNGTPTSLQDLVDAINAQTPINASIQPDGTFALDAPTNTKFSFSEDSSGVLAVLGIGTYFSGSDAFDIDVRSDLEARHLSVGTLTTISADASDAAIRIAQIGEQPIEALEGLSIEEAWLAGVQNVATKTAAADTRATASFIVQQSLEAQRASISGVNVDEESVNLITYQQQYESAARFISTVNDLTDTLISIL